MTAPFSTYIQALGKGRRGARNLTFAEAEHAMQCVLQGTVSPEQLGAFLMLLRVKEETPAELAGMVKAARDSIVLPPSFPPVELDWAAYAGKRRQLPYFVLSALLLAQHGIKVLMHGSAMAGRVNAADALAQLGFAACHNANEAAAQLQQRNFAYLPVATLNPRLQHLLALKATLGLRSPVHSVVRMFNPARAKTSLLGIFHPGYDTAHQAAGVLLGDENLAVFKGEGGDAERNPDSDCLVRGVLAGAAQDELWAAQFLQRHLKDEAMDMSRLGALWRGEISDEYALAAVIGTAAIALRAMQRAPDAASAMLLAQQLWDTRRLDFLPDVAAAIQPQIGSVALVGAGPGDPDLLTLRALRLIQTAEVLVYDNLVAPAIVALSHAEKIFVGKQRAQHTLPQVAINDLLVRLALEGKKVVRLKGGDPFIFGRGGEEIETLAAQKIPFQVVPGITAASGVAAYAGIPLTHRDHAQSCVFVTGHLKDGTMNLDWDALARPQQTVVVYMGLLGINTLCAELIKHGLAAGTPAALVQQGTTQNQRVLAGTLATLPDIVLREKPHAPTLIIIGGVVSLHDKLSWFTPHNLNVS
ncbi:MAG: hypothetical protein RL358_382 [Pseudomonadota bacterium]|jgi:uroporphyrin-III C-methyltransferase